MSKRSTSDHKPTAANVDFPVYIPGENGETKLEVGKARLRAGTLVVEFRDTAAGVILQNMIQRGVLLGMSMILLQPDELNLKYQETLEVEELREKLDPTAWERYANGEIEYEEAVRLGGKLADPVSDRDPDGLG